MQYPTLSVVMTNYNHGRYIGKAIQSILSQSFKPTELIIIDDSSKDNSIEIIEQFQRSDQTIQLIRNQKNMGVQYNINLLLKLAKGDYIAFQAADDKLLPGIFYKSMALLAQYPQAGLCSARTLCIDAEGKAKGVLHQPVISNKSCFVPPDKALSILHKHGSWIQGNTTIYRRRALIDSGGFIPELQAGSDAFIHQVIAVKYGVCFIPEALAAWRQLESSYSATFAKDPELCLRFIRHAKMLMCSTYRDLFPSVFVDCWEKRELLNNRLARFLNLQNVAFEDLKHMIPSQGLMDKCLFGLRQFFTKIEYAFLKAYLYYRVGLPANQLFIQRVKRLLGAVSKRLSM